jgi:hypothetical protein
LFYHFIVFAQHILIFCTTESSPEGRKCFTHVHWYFSLHCSLRVYNIYHTSHYLMEAVLADFENVCN